MIRPTAFALLATALLATLSPAQIAVNGNVFDGQGGPLLRGQVYTTLGLNVPPGETLTIEVGAILKIDVGAITVHGVLNVIDNGASPNEMAVLTSLHDDIGGNTNQSPQQPTPGDWSNLRFPTGDGTLDRLEVRYAGSGNQASILLTTNPSFTGCLIRDGRNAAVNLTNQSYATFTGCRFEDCARPVESVRLDAVAGFAGCTAAGNTEGDAMAAINSQWTGTLSIGPNNLFADQVLKMTSATVLPGSTLELQAGVICKMNFNSVLTVAGAMRCLGTANDPVAFTSIRDVDPAFGGNSNGSATQPAAARGDWVYIYCSVGSNVEMQETQVRFAGRNGGSAIWPRTGVKLDRCVISESAGSAINMQQMASLAGLSITNCDFHHNSDTAMRRVTWKALERLIDNTASDNDGGDYVAIYDTAVTGSVNVYPWNYPNDVLVCNWSINVPAGESLTLHPGVAIKQLPAVGNTIAGNLNLNGTGSRKVVITSLDDDDRFGDTAKDGPPAADPRAWFGLVCNPTSTVRIHHAELAWAGWAGRPTLDFQCPGYDVFGVRVDNAFGTAFQIRALGTLTQCAAFHGRQGFNISGNGNGQELHHITATECTLRGVWQVHPAICTIKNSIVYGNAEDFFGFANTNGVVTHTCGGGMTLPLGVGNLSADPQFVDQAQGDLRLSATSPCVNHGLAALPAPLPIVDIDENSRRSDSLLAGNDATDMGAYERVRWTFDVEGWLRPDHTITLGTRGPAGFSFVGVGAGFWATHIAPLGYLAINPLYNQPLSPLGPFPIGANGDFSITMPSALPPGLPINLQAICFGDAGSGGGAGFTNVHRMTTH